MRQLTIAELRAKQVIKLANMAGDADIAAAQKVMNSFYRFAGFCVRKFYFENDSRLYSEAKAERLEKVFNRRYAAMNQKLKPYGLQIVFYGLYPTITDKMGNNAVIDTYYYQN